MLIYILAVLGIIFLILLYFICGIFWLNKEMSSYGKEEYKFLTTYDLLINNKLKNLTKKYPDKYKYEFNTYWYNGNGTLEYHSGSAYESPIIIKYQNKIINLIEFLWPLFIISTSIRYLIYKIKNRNKNEDLA